LEAFALGGFHADLTLIVDLDPATGLERTLERGEKITRFEKFDAGYHERLRQAFLDIASASPKRCVVLDGALPPGSVLEAAIAAIDKRLSTGR